MYKEATNQLLQKTSFGPINQNANDTLIISFAPYTTNTTITIAPGTCTGANIVTELNAKLAASNIEYPFLVSFNSTTNILTLANTTTNAPFRLIYPGSTSAVVLGFANVNPSIITGTHCTLTSEKITDNNGGANVLAKIQLTTDSTGIEFYNNLTAFKTRFYDTNLSSVHIVLYDENFNPWVPQSDWSCVIEMTFYEKYNLTAKQKTNNLLFSN